MHHKDQPPLQRAVCELDRDLLLLLQRRHNLLARMGGHNGHISPAEEKTLREAWQAASARVSNDPRLASQFFVLLQDIRFYQQAAQNGEDADAVPDSGLRQAFNLAPARSPVRVNLHAPLDNAQTCAWLLLAAASGQQTRLDPCLVCDPQLHFMRALELMGARTFRDGDTLGTDTAALMGAPDKSLHMGDGAASFFLLLGHYVMRPSRARFSAENGLKAMDLGPVMHALPALGARLTPVVPKGNAFPLRLECSGHVPGSFAVPADVPNDFVRGLLLAAPFADHAITFDLSAHPEAQTILADSLPMLRTAKADVVERGNNITITPGPLAIPAAPALPMDVDLCAFVAALPLVLGGEVRLAGSWPETPKGRIVADVLTASGLDLKFESAGVIAKATDTLAFGKVDGFGQTPAAQSMAGTLAPLVTSLAACAALEGGKGSLPAAPAAEAAAFMHSVGLAQDGEGLLSAKAVQDTRPVVWSAPSPCWALALALAACAREKTSQGFKLGNPGIIKDLWPAFWSLYNGLPTPGKPRDRERDRQHRPGGPAHRRIRTRATAVLPPEIIEDD